MYEGWRNLNASDGLPSTANTTAATERRAALVRRLMAGLLLASVGETRGNTLRSGENSSRRRQAIGGFALDVSGIAAATEPQLPIATPDQQPPTDS